MKKRIALLLAFSMLTFSAFAALQTMRIGTAIEINTAGQLTGSAIAMNTRGQVVPKNVDRGRTQGVGGFMLLFWWDEDE